MLILTQYMCLCYPSLFRFVCLDLFSSSEEKWSARYEGTSPAATKGLVIGVPFPGLEADDTGIELNEGGFCAEELGTSTVSSDSGDELDIDDSGITLYLTSMELCQVTTPQVMK